MPRMLASVSSLIAAAALATTFGFSVQSASAQCASGWQPGTANSDMDGLIRWLRSWDPDGNGPLSPVLAAGGDFTTAGTASASRIATWDGSNWSALDSGINGSVYCLTSLSSNNRLFASGASFGTAGGNPAKRLAQWDGAAWSDVATDGGSSLALLTVTALNPTKIVITGAFTNVGAGPVPANRVAAWDSTTNTWSALGSGMSSTTSAAVVLQNGDLVVGGAALTTGDGATVVNRIARWDGTDWNAMGTGLNGLVRCFVVMPNGDLIVGGAFTASGDGSIPLNHLARWNITNGWSAIGTGTSGTATLTPVPDPYALAVASNGDLLVAGDFTMAGSTPANRIARWDGTNFTAFGSGLNAVVRAMSVLPDGSIAVGGDFTTAGGTAAARFAVWSDRSPVSIDVQPVTTSVCTNGDPTAVFSLTASGSGPITYQWQQQDLLNLPDFVNISDGPVLDPFNNVIGTASGTNTNSLSLSNLAGVAQIFRCVVTNACGPVESSEATLTFCQADHDCSGGLAVADIFSFLNDWFASLPVADFDQADGVSVADIFAFLNAWFEGC